MNWGKAKAVMDSHYAQVVAEEYAKPYQLRTVNCVTKAIKIIDAARAEGHTARMMFCVAVLPAAKHAKTKIPEVWGHSYPEVDGVRVDVTLSPADEAEYCKNEEVKRLWPIHLPWTEGLFRRVYNLPELKERNEKSEHN